MTSLISRMAALNSRLTDVALKFGAWETILTFQVNSGVLQEDPETGVQSLAPAAVVIKAFLQQARSQAKNLENLEAAWNNPSVIYVEGHLIEPVTLPETIRPSMVAQAALSNPYHPVTYQTNGEFLLLPTLSSDKQIHGHHLRGYLKFNPGAL